MIRKTLVIALIAALTACGGYLAHQPGTVIIERVRVVEIELPPEIIIKTEVKVIMVPTPYHDTVLPRPFRDKDELLKWVDNYDPHLYNFNNGTQFGLIDCEDYTYFDMGIAATMDGYIMEVGFTENPGHVFCTVPIPSENSLYIVDPSVRPIEVKYWRELD